MEVKIERGEVVTEITTPEGTEIVTPREAVDRIMGSVRYDEKRDIPELVGGLVGLINTYEDMNTTESKSLLRNLVNDFTYAMDPYISYDDQEWCAMCEATWGQRDEPVHKDDCAWKSLLNFLDMDDPFSS